jgi:hypothetical protein
MRSDEQIADEVLRRTLIEVKATRMRRRAVKGAVAAVMVLTMGIFLLNRPVRLVVTEPGVVEAVSPLPLSEDDAIAVMVWKDGAARLEWIKLRDLGTVELQLSLEPVFAFSDDG